MKDSQIRHCRKLRHRSRFHRDYELVVHNEVDADAVADDFREFAAIG